MAYISGFQNRKIAVTEECDFDTGTLFVHLPGYSYNLDYPFFYYITELLRELRINQLSFHFKWSEQKALFGQPEGEVFTSLGKEIAGAFDYVQSRSYDKLFIVAKSLGTAALQQIRRSESLSAMRVKALFWVTPFANTASLRDLDFEVPVHDYFYVGTADEFYDQEIYASLKRKAAVREFEGLGHTFDIQGDVTGSIESLGNVIREIRDDILKETTGDRRPA